jgi:hypothetical protein
MRQIDAASRIHAQLVQWRWADGALGALRNAFGDFGPEACLLKVVAVNSLYGTNVYAVLRMAAHVRDVMNDPGRPSGAVALVERLADLRAKEGEKKRYFVSFASKFAHFFVSSDVPIYDSFAERMLKWHLGRRRGIWDADRPYNAFVQNVERLRHESGVQADVRVLDHYLWLAGQVRAWEKLKLEPGRKDKTNRELAEILRNPPVELSAGLAVLKGG